MYKSVLSFFTRFLLFFLCVSCEVVECYAPKLASPIQPVVFIV